MHHIHLLIAVLLLALPASVPSTVFAQEQLVYRKLFVGSRVSLEVPSHWRVRDPDDRRNIAAAADAMRDSRSSAADPMHVSALSVTSMLEPVGAIIRISFVPSDGLTQAEAVHALRTNRAATLKEVQDTWNSERADMLAGMERSGIKLLGKESFGTESIGGKTAFTVTYRRTSPIGQSPFTVVQYHIPLGEVKVLITLSHRESSVLTFRPILERLKKTISIT